LRDYKVTIEYKHLKSHAPGGVYLIPYLDSLRDFHGVIFVRRGPYTNGIFKFTLSLNPTYNDVNQHPVIRFISHVYNPYVHEATGELDIKTAYPRWDPSRHYLVTVLTFLKKIFYAKSFDDAKANLEAKELAQTNPTAFKTNVDHCVRESQKNVYDPDELKAISSSGGSGGTGATVLFTEEKLSHRVLRDLLKANIPDPAQASKNAILAMIDKASKV
jgi:ubiquitin-protein ligase